jgi:predicted small lipoprotein YifL
MKRAPILLTLLATAALVAGCGQKGPLRLPETTREPTTAGGSVQPTPSKTAPSARGDGK